MIFELNSPYGGYREFVAYAFVKKGSPVATSLNRAAALGDDPLAMIVKLNWQKFPHGNKHLVIDKVITEGWFE